MREVLWDWLATRVTRVRPSAVFPGCFLVTIGDQTSVATLDDLRALQASLDEMLGLESLPQWGFDEILGRARLEEVA